MNSANIFLRKIHQILPATTPCNFPCLSIAFEVVFIIGANFCKILFANTFQTSAHPSILPSP